MDKSTVREFDQRSPHAIAVDKGIQAKKVYSDDKFKNWRSNKNRTDLNDYDTRTTTKPPREEDLPDKHPVPKKPIPFNTPRETPKEEKKEQQQEPKETKQEYAPSRTERFEAMTIFATRPVFEQLKDIETTHNVVTNKKQYEQWKKNPKASDVRGIDTRPEELSINRINVVAQMTKVPMLSRKEAKNKGYRIRMNTGTIGMYMRQGTALKPASEDIGIVIVNPKKTHGQPDDVWGMSRILAHEYGHAYHSQIMKDKHPFSGFNYDKFVAKNPKKEIGFGRMNYDRVAGKVEKVVFKKISPFDVAKARLHGNTRYIRYRQENSELFADWFSGLITKKNIVKKHSRTQYNIFKNQNKELFKAFRQADQKTLQKLIGKF